MISSVPENYTGGQKRIVYFTEVGNIKQILAAPKEDVPDNERCAWFSLKSVAPFLNGQEGLTKYKVVKRDSGGYDIVKRKATLPNIVRLNQIFEIKDSGDADVSLTIHDGEMKIVASEEIIDAYKHNPTHKKIVILNETHHSFYITVKNRPEFLIETIQIELDDLVRGVECKAPFNHDINNVSIRTRRFFDTYSVETK